MNNRIVQILLFSFLVVNSFLFSESDGEENWGDLPMARLMPLATEYPLVLSDENRYGLLEGPEILVENQGAIRSQLRSRLFPWFLLFGFAVAGVTWALYITWRHKHGVIIPKKLELSLSEKLELTFLEIQKNRWIENRKVQLLYPKLEKLMHEFISTENREMTSREYEKTLKHATQFSLDEKKKMVKYLRAFDEVKFAGKEPTVEEARQTVKEIYELLKAH